LLDIKKQEMEQDKNEYLLNHRLLIMIQTLILASSAGISPEESGGWKKFGEMPAINQHKNVHCA
jgi:hypothetical protein